RVIRPIPLRPSTSEAQNVAVSCPTGDITPQPVTTTRRRRTISVRAIAAPFIGAATPDWSSVQHRQTRYRPRCEVVSLSPNPMGHEQIRETLTVVSLRSRAIVNRLAACPNPRL